MHSPFLRVFVAGLIGATISVTEASAGEIKTGEALFRRDNLIAWCIVPFDAEKRGPIGILGHTQDDAEARLQDNLDGLDWLVPQLDGKPAVPKPRPRTPVPQAKPPAE